MEPTTRRASPDAIAAALAGLQAGLVAAFGFIVWLGVSAVLELHIFWTPEILMASVFYGPAAIRGEAQSAAFVGLAVYLLVYSLAGAMFAALVRTRLPRFRLTLVSICFGLALYLVLFRFGAGHWAPLVRRLHPAGPTLWGHVIYGGLLARYRLYLESPPDQRTLADGEATECGEAALESGAVEPENSEMPEDRAQTPPRES